MYAATAAKPLLTIIEERFGQNCEWHFGTRCTVKYCVYYVYCLDTVLANPKDDSLSYQAF
jgi:hypothetical protein